VLDIAKLQRRLKYALKKTKIRVALGGIDFSLNEDREGKYQPFWCPHVYLITSTKNKNKLGNKLRRIYLKSEEVRVPVKITSLENNAYRRSYALKMHFKRRIGYLDIKCKHEKIRECRNANGSGIFRMALPRGAALRINHVVNREDRTTGSARQRCATRKEAEDLFDFCPKTVTEENRKAWVQQQCVALRTACRTHRGVYSKFAPIKKSDAERRWRSIFMGTGEEEAIEEISEAAGQTRVSLTSLRQEGKPCRGQKSS
jgi:hypothetical protein